MDSILKFSKWLGIPLAALYLVSMVIAPIYLGDWDYVQSVWQRWQALNVGILAFASSLIALNLTSYKSEQDRVRQMKAARAVLPSALSDLCFYTENIGDFYKEAWEAMHGRGKFDSSLPEMPTSHEPIFQECIRHGSQDLDFWMSSILKLMQIQNTRMRYLRNEFGQFNRDFHSYHILTQLYQVAELRARIDKLFPFARNERKRPLDKVNSDEVYVAYSELEINCEDFTAKSPFGEGYLDLTDVTDQALNS